MKYEVVFMGACTLFLYISRLRSRKVHLLFGVPIYFSAAGRVLVCLCEAKFSWKKTEGLLKLSVIRAL